MQNPFYCGDALPLGKFVGRENEFRRVTSQIWKGSSTLIVGDPRVGKTSFLNYLSASLDEPCDTKLWFQYIDMLCFDEKHGPSDLWKFATEPLYEGVFKTMPRSRVFHAYKECVKSNFSRSDLLNIFFKELNVSGWRLVLLWDEFDVVLEHPKLNTKKFLGDFRSLTSNNGAFSPIMAARKSRVQLDSATAGYNSASQYFNHISEIVLGPLKDRDCAKVLAEAKERFTATDRCYLVELTGGHPYLLQVAASELWEAYIEFPQDADQRWKQMKNKFYRAAASTFDEMWRLWSPEVRMAFTAAVLPQISLDYPRFRNQNLLRSLRNLNGQLYELRDRGLIVDDNESTSQWRVRSLIALWWLANQIAEAIHAQISYEEWLQKQHIEGLITTREQRKQWNEVWNTAGEVLKDGTKALVEAIGKGVGGGLLS